MSCTTVTIPTPESLACIKCDITRDMATAVLELGFWPVVRDFEGKSFMLHAPEISNKLDAHPLVAKHGHSGVSFGFCLRNVQYIAKHGIDAFNLNYSITY